MKKIRRILSFIVAMAMIMSMSTLCFLVTAEGESAVKLGTQWNFDIAVGEVGSDVTSAKGQFSIASSGRVLKSKVETFNGVASIVTEDGERAFSQSTAGIIDVTPSKTTKTQIIFTAPVTGQYYYDFAAELVTTASEPIRLWTEIGPTPYNAETGYTVEGINNTGDGSWPYNAVDESFTKTATVTLNEGDTILFQVTADEGEGCNDTDETQLAVKKFNVTYMGEAATTTSESLDLTIGTDAAAAKKESETTGFSLGAMYKVGNEYVEVELEDAARTAWENDLDSYLGWYPAVDGAPYVFLRSAQGGILNMRPTSDNGDYLAVIKYTATEAGDYFVVGSFTKVTFDGRIHDRKTEAEDVDSDITDYLSVQKDGVVYASATMSEEAPTANLSATVYLDAGESLYIVERNDYLWTGSAETVVNSLTVYKSAHVCADWNDDATCNTGATCVECGTPNSELDPDNHTEAATSYVDNGNGTHNATYPCCTTVTENHDFSMGDTCACGAVLNEQNADYVITFDPNSADGKQTTSNESTFYVKLQLSGNAENYASGKIVVLYDADVFDFDVAASTLPDVDVQNNENIATNEGKLVLVIYGDQKEKGDIAILAFKAKAVTTESEIVISEAGFSTQSDAETEDLTPAIAYYSTVTVEVTAREFDVTPGEGLTGAGTALEGNDYTFTPESPYYDYEEPVVMVDDDNDGTPETDISDKVTLEDGTWTIPGEYVTGDIAITVVRTEKNYTASVNEPSYTVDFQTGLTYNTDYSFTVIKDTWTAVDGGIKYEITSITMNGDDIKDEFTSVTNGDGTVTYTISGTNVTGNIDIVITANEYGADGVDVELTGPGVSGDTFASFENDYKFTVTLEEGWIYTITYKVGEEGTVKTPELVEGSYVVPVAEFTDELADTIYVTVSRVLDLNVEVHEYLTLQGGSKIWLVLNRAATKLENSHFTMNGNAMFWSEKYEAYCYLVVADTLDVATAEAYTYAVADGVATEVDYGMNVNMSASGNVDANDAQLVYNMYCGTYYNADTALAGNVTVEKYLRADVGADLDYAVDALDAVAIVTYCLNN